MINFIEAKKEDIKVFKGDTFTFPVTVIDSQTKLPIDLTGASVLMQVKVDKEDEISVLEISTANGRANVGNGIININVSDEVMGAIEAGVYFYDLQIVFLDGTKKTWLVGMFIITQDTSRE